MTYDADLDPKRWKAERFSKDEAIKQLKETLDAEKEKTRRWQQKYFDLKKQVDGQ